MKKLKRGEILVIGEGITEMYYFNSLKDIMPHIRYNTIQTKHSSFKEYDFSIKRGIDDEYSEIYCIVDLDMWDNDSLKSTYLKLKTKYTKKKSDTTIKFIETRPCTELFFLYYFEYTNRHFHNQEALLKELQRYCRYEKTAKFFQEVRNLHSYFVKSGGSLQRAIENSQKSVNQTISDSYHSFSEIGLMINSLSETD